VTPPASPTTIVSPRPEFVPFTATISAAPSPLDVDPSHVRPAEIADYDVVGAAERPYGSSLRAGTVYTYELAGGGHGEDAAGLPPLPVLGVREAS
jgi:hypothetical protein